MKKINITYLEKGNEIYQTGKVELQDFYASCFNVTNQSGRIKNKPNMQVSVQTRLMGKGTLKSDFRFNLSSKSHKFSYQGSLSEMSMTAFNPFIEPLTNISIKEGISKSITFDVDANKNMATGVMNFEYKNLKIAVQKKDKEDKQGIKEKVKSFFANLFVVKKDNPKKNEPLRKAYISYERDPTKSFFNYYWKTLLSGMKTSIGIEQEGMAKINNEKNDK